MALTDEEKLELKQEILDEIKASSEGADELETVDTLDGVTSLPALKDKQLVSVPIEQLRKPAEDAAQLAKKAAAAATAAATNANAAAESATKNSATAIENAKTAAMGANSAASAAGTAAANANNAAAKYEGTAVVARNGATARFDGYISDEGEASRIPILGGVPSATPTAIMYYEAERIFVAREGDNYYNDWTGSELFNSGGAVLKNKIFLCGATMYVWSDEENDLVEASGSGSGAGFYNVTIEQPLPSGYYTLETAIAALANADIDDDAKPGMIITFEVSAGKWVDYRFCASSIENFLTVASWEEYGGGKIKQINVNGQTITPDAEGKVNIVIDEQEVDTTLDQNSTNPVQNSTVTAKFNEIEAATVFDMSAEVSDDESTVRLALKNKSGAEIAAVDIPAGSGGGEGDASTTKIVLNASVDNPIVKEGGNVKLTYAFDHQYSSGDDKGVSTGQKATISIQMLRGSTTTYSDTITEVSKGSYDIDISKYLFAGTTDIYVRATTTDPSTGKTQTKQSYISVKVVTLTLSSSYNLANSIANGGYGASESISIPYAVSGSGTKVVTLYVDGTQRNAHTVTRSGTTNGSFNLSMSGLSVGRHTVQIVAEMEASSELTLRSESVYMDIFKAGKTTPLIGIKHTFKDGRVFTANHLTPHLEIGQYEQLAFDFVVYNPDATPASMVIFRNGAITQGVSVPRSTQVYSNRFTEQGENSMKFVCGVTEYPFYIDVAESDIDISETTYGLKMKLDATGRSNEESEPDVWADGDIFTTFENVDWKTSGWIDNSLKLINGAKATINYKALESDISSTGATFEFEFRISNVVDREATVISCMDGDKGFKMTAEEAAMLTGSTKNVTTADGDTLTTPVGVSMKFAPDIWLKVAFVVNKRVDGRLMELYINGKRSKGDIYGNGDYFSQDNPVPISIDSSKADVEIRRIRIYDRAISDDEELNNLMIDCKTVDEMTALIQANDILNPDTGEVDMDKLLAKGKSIMLVVREGGLEEVNATNNKDTDFHCDYIRIVTPWGDVYEFYDVNIRIQGTSSTKYPMKNYRIYIAKGKNPRVYINGVLQEEKKVPLSKGGIPVERLNPKCDYADSSMTHNTGFAKLVNDVFKELGLLTPPQRINSEIRTTVDGFPIDVFSAETMDGERTYYGQYNLNNDKSDWADLTGMNPVKAADGTTIEWACPIALEFLNNSYALGKFQLSGTSDAEVETEMSTGFDDALEFNYPKDLYWSETVATKEEGDVADDKRKAAIKRLWTWIRDCVPAGADMTCKDLSTWKSEKFKNEIAQYFDVPFLLTYYVCTDYKALVDQRVKNMIARTWDGLIWYITYYDGDTALLLRNDCFLAYLYTLSRETYDYEKGGYAFEGFDSWLWCLVLANMETELKACAKNLRQVLTNARVLDMLNKEQSGNWCERIYNKSGKLKYIDPQINGVNVGGNIVTYPYIYALQGDREAHRTHTINNRFALLDAKYETGNYTSDNIDLYMSRTATDGTTTMQVTANEVYYFGYGTNNTPSIQPSQKAEEGENVTLSFNAAYSLNDPMRIYGASRMRKLVTSSAGDDLVGNINLNKCVVLQELDMSTTGGGGDFYINLDNCRQLVQINMRGQSKARTGSQASTEFDFSNQTKLRTFDGTGTTVKSVAFAKGAPLASVVLPSTLTSLRLEYLPNLQMSGLTIAGYNNIETFVFSACSGLNWQTLLGRCTNVVRIRIEGLALEGDGELLNTYLNKKGVDAEGNAVETCALVGNYKLTRYPSDADLATWRAHYPELNIQLPQYTMIEFDDSVSDDANVSNLDNSTGYKFGNDYVPSGHITAINSKRHRVLAKVTKMPTNRSITHAGVDTLANNSDGTVTIYPLHDENSNYYADAEVLANCSAAKLDGTEGDVMMYEPHYWKKGINDYLNGKKYACFSVNGEMPDTPDVDVLTLEEIQAAGKYKDKSKLMSGKGSLSASYGTDSNYAVCEVDVSGYKKVRFPTVLGTNLICSLFVDDAGNILATVVVSTLAATFENGMYLVHDVPEGATALHFTIHKTAEFDKVVLSNSDRIEDMEPDWVEHKACLTAVFGSSIVGTKLRSAITGGSTAASMSWSDFHYYSQQRGMQQIDWSMHCDIANLFYAMYGRRDSQMQCGVGSNSNSRTTGGTAKLGMNDTLNTDGTTIGGHESAGLAFYKTENSDGTVTFTRINNTNCLGYEDIYNHKYDMMDGVEVNKGSVTGKWLITNPDGTQRVVKGGTTSDIWIRGVVYGKFMDMMAAGSVSGSSSTYYCDKYYYGAAVGRVVYRGGSYASAYGGVAYASAYGDALFTIAFIGSRLAFRGEIEVAESVADFKAAVEVA